MITSANIFTNIQSEKEYFPENNESVIYQLHCIKTNECPVKVWSYNNHKPITFPEGSFIQGAVYPMVIFKMEFDEEMASFVGYKSSANIGLPRYIPKNWKPKKN
jgi:hypothetical protein